MVMPTSQAHHIAKGVNSFFYLNINFILSMIYFSLLVSGFTLAFGLIFILIGLPLFAFMIAAMRKLAIFDRQFSAAMIGRTVPPMQDPIPAVQGGLLTRLRAYLTSPFTWQSGFYMLLKFMLSSVTFTIAWTLFPFWLLELILNSIGIDTGQIIARMMFWLAWGSQVISDVFIGENLDMSNSTAEKPKRRADRAGEEEKPKRETGYRLDENLESVYYLDDEGEIVQRVEKR